MFAVGAVPESPMVGGAVVVPADAAGGIGHEVGADVADGVESDLEFESGVGEGVAVAVELDAEVAGVGVDFEIVVVAAPAPAVALASAFIVDGKMVVAADVGAATQDHGVASVGVEVYGLVAVVVVVVGTAEVEEGVTFVDVECAMVVFVVGHDDEGGVAGGDEAFFDGGFAAVECFVAPEVADVLPVGDEVGEMVGTGGGGDGVEGAFFFAVGYPPAGGTGSVDPREVGGAASDR